MAVKNLNRQICSDHVISKNSSSIFQNRLSTLTNLNPEMTGPFIKNKNWRRSIRINMILKMEVRIFFRKKKTKKSICEKMLKNLHLKKHLEVDK